MTPDERLAEVLTALDAVGVRCLVMGGHAVRYYGLGRNTDDFDLHLAADCWHDLTDRLRRSTLFRGEPVEGPSWRAATFRRFEIGTLASGREEWLEFWKENHLLPRYEEVYGRREEGQYGGRLVAFLSLPDLIRSKETERESDWQDVLRLEEFLDARLAARAKAGEIDRPAALAALRSRRGFETHFAAGTLADAGAVRAALATAPNPVTVAYLLPLAPDFEPAAGGSIEPVILARLRTVAPASPLHLTLAEAVRRRYKLDAQDADKADKQAVRAAQGAQDPKPAG